MKFYEDKEDFEDPINDEEETEEIEDMNDEMEVVSEASLKMPAISNESEIKEGVVCLFYDMLANGAISIDDVDMISTFFEDAKSQTSLSKDPRTKATIVKILDFIKKNKNSIQKEKRYGNSFSPLVYQYINWFSTNSNVPNKLQKNFNNSISIASRIYSDYGTKLGSNSFADMGEKYNQIRNNAVAMVSELTGDKLSPDKWSPADMFIYKNMEVSNSIVKMKNAKEYNIGKNSFMTSFDSSRPSILAISLKEQVARQGKATSFAPTVLKQSEHFSNREDVFDDDKRFLMLLNETLILLDNDIQKKSTELEHYWNKSSRSLKKRFSRNKTLIIKREKNKSLTISAKTFERQLGKNKASWEILKALKIHVKRKLGGSFRQNCNVLLTKEKSAFFSLLKRLKIPFVTKKDIKGFYQNKDIPQMDSKHLFAKIDCYRTANHVISDFDQVGVKDVYKSLSKTKNPFAALTAYAVGMAGFSPTFIKITGSNSGLNAGSDIVYGAGILDLATEGYQVNIIDSIAAGSFKVSFIVNAWQSTRAQNISKQYKTTMTFQSEGRTVKIEVEEFKAKEKE